LRGCDSHCRSLTRKNALLKDTAVLGSLLGEAKKSPTSGVDEGLVGDCG
jgi:hypothetical protein